MPLSGIWPRARRRLPLANLLFCQTVERRRADAEDAEVNVDLAAVVDFMFDHRAQPLADAQLRASRSGALLVQIGVGERSKNLHRFFVHAAKVRERRVVVVGELAAISRIAASSALAMRRSQARWRRRFCTSIRDRAT